ncbi:hypothetical protein BCR42DRAFT_427395 [Absidia repens]|uniref:Uncharacterized protein n=1 Tax=Absidia repens TaxID=90262 RepID=A0A1X2I080_9FUNG|nr:hypothetical protein BCR42DRAFT_427395 [Absidia repens]
MLMTLTQAISQVFTKVDDTLVKLNALEEMYTSQPLPFKILRSSEDLDMFGVGMVPVLLTSLQTFGEQLTLASQANRRSKHAILHYWYNIARYVAKIRMLDQGQTMETIAVAAYPNLPLTTAKSRLLRETRHGNRLIQLAEICETVAIFFFVGDEYNLEQLFNLDELMNWAQN